MKHEKLTIVASASLLLTLEKIKDSDEAMRHLLRMSVDDLEPAWFDSNKKIIDEAQPSQIWPGGLDCVNWPELKLLNKNGNYFPYPIEIIPATSPSSGTPNYVFICCATDSSTVPGWVVGKEHPNLMYYTMYPECMTGEEILWQVFPLASLPVRDGMHRTRIDNG